MVTFQKFICMTQRLKWIKRCLFPEAIGRIVSVSLKDVESFYLKLILHRVKGATCFEDLKIHEHIAYNTFKEIAIAMGLVERDKVIFNIFVEGRRSCTRSVKKIK